MWKETKVMRILRQASPVLIVMDQTQPENLGSVIRDVARFIREFKSSMAMAKAAFSKKKTLFASKLDLRLREKLEKNFIWSIAWYGAGSLTLQTVDQKYLESFEM
jgi:hypothetical protein